jgi:hypothetical protein
MTVKHILIFSMFLLLITGCSLLQSPQKPQLEQAPDYYAPSDPMFDAKKYHNKEVDSMSDQVHVFRNREMDKLQVEGKREEEWRQDYADTMQKRAKWKNWLHKGNDETLMMSDKAKEINANLK